MSERYRCVLSLALTLAFSGLGFRVFSLSLSLSSSLFLSPSTDTRIGYLIVDGLPGKLPPKTHCFARQAEIQGSWRHSVRVATHRLILITELYIDRCVRGRPRSVEKPQLGYHCWYINNGIVRYDCMYL